ncbi:MAG: aminodeoxychorismate synthase component I [Proteobacteria bacterium]|nr:aminodeoxychorismate synthase component I [Pseudomonadota bacterium]
MYISILPYFPDSNRLFLGFANQPFAVFLDSCERARFDIICANPIKTWIADQEPTQVFDIAKKIIQSYQINYSQIPEDLPFSVGLIGYFSYDLGYSLLNIKAQAKKDIGLPVAVLGFYEWSIIVDHLKKTCYLISLKPPNDPAIESVKQTIFSQTLERNDFILLEDFSPNMSKSQYAAAFDQVKAHIKAGDCYQINLAQRFSANYQGAPWLAYQNLKRRNPVPMAAYLNLPQGQILSFSPERFLQVKAGQVLTQPIKGTSPRFEDPLEDSLSAQALLSSEKDRAENMMIVDLLRNDLGKCCHPGSIKVNQLCQLESLKNVHHLVSSITGKLEESQHPFDLLKQCFPGGSITGAPKKRAMEIIDQLEPHHRSAYCGSIAYCDIRGRFDSNILIRTLICYQHKIHCYGGGGLVHDSTVDKEYQEIHIKIHRLLSTLNQELCLST